MPKAPSQIASAHLKVPSAALADLYSSRGKYAEGERDGHLGMVGAEGLLADRQRLLVEAFGLRVLALLLAHNCQIVEGLGDFGMTPSDRVPRSSARPLPADDPRQR
jgi:hypothetical protein